VEVKVKNQAVHLLLGENLTKKVKRVNLEIDSFSKKIVYEEIKMERPFSEKIKFNRKFCCTA
jgi:hypothetical protein